MNKAIKVRTVESKLSQKGNMYYPITLDDGSKASAFDKDFVEQVLTVAMDKNIPVEVDLETNEQGYTNIRPKKEKANGGTVYSSGSVKYSTPKETIKAPSTSKFDNTPMYVSYAKDIFVSLMEKDTDKNAVEDLMNASIKLVKQAKEGLK